jgi:hypothetical protein
MPNDIQPVPRVDEMLSNSQLPSISSVALRIPPFCTDDPELWFSIAERSFAAAGIRDDAAKTANVLITLDSRTRQAVREEIVSLPGEHQYLTLKKALVTRFGTSQREKTRQLLANQQRGDRSAGQYLRHLRYLAGNEDANSQIVEEIWRRAFPAQIQITIAALADKPIEELAIIVDRMLDTTAQIAPITMTPQLQEPSTAHSQDLAAVIAGITDQLREMSGQIDELRRPRPNNRQSSSYNYNNRQEGQDHFNNSQGGRYLRNNRGTEQNRDNRQLRDIKTWCFFHNKYGRQAYKCKPPCTFPRDGRNAGNDGGKL